MLVENIGIRSTWCSGQAGGKVRVVGFSAASETRMCGKTPPEFFIWKT